MLREDAEQTVFLHDRVGTPINWTLSAVGRAYLAHCPDSEREKILAVLRKSALPENRLARDDKRLQQILGETRSRGYATRDPSFGGGAYRRQAQSIGWLISRSARPMSEV